MFTNSRQALSWPKVEPIDTTIVLQALPDTGQVIPVGNNHVHGLLSIKAITPHYTQLYNHFFSNSFTSLFSIFSMS